MACYCDGSVVCLTRPNSCRGFHGGGSWARLVNAPCAPYSSALVAAGVRPRRVQLEKDTGGLGDLVILLLRLCLHFATDRWRGRRASCLSGSRVRAEAKLFKNGEENTENVEKFNLPSLGSQAEGAYLTI